MRTERLSQLSVLFLQIRSPKTPNSYGKKRVFSTERRCGQREAFSSEGASDTPTSTSETPPRDTSFPSRFPENGLEVSAPRAPRAFCNWRGGPRGRPPAQPGLSAGQERTVPVNSGGCDRGQPHEQPLAPALVAPPCRGHRAPISEFSNPHKHSGSGRGDQPQPRSPTLRLPESPRYRTDARILAPASRGRAGQSGQRRQRQKQSLLLPFTGKDSALLP